MMSTTGLIAFIVVVVVYGIFALWTMWKNGALVTVAPSVQKLVRGIWTRLKTIRLPKWKKISLTKLRLRLMGRGSAPVSTVVAPSSPPTSSPPTKTAKMDWRGAVKLAVQTAGAIAVLGFIAWKINSSAKEHPHWLGNLVSRIGNWFAKLPRRTMHWFEQVPSRVIHWFNWWRFGAVVVALLVICALFFLIRGIIRWWRGRSRSSTATATHTPATATARATATAASAPAKARDWSALRNVLATLFLSAVAAVFLWFVITNAIKETASRENPKIFKVEDTQVFNNLRRGAVRLNYPDSTGSSVLPTTVGHRFQMYVVPAGCEMVWHKHDQGAVLDILAPNGKRFEDGPGGEVPYDPRTRWIIVRSKDTTNIKVDFIVTPYDQRICKNPVSHTSG